MNLTMCVIISNENDDVLSSLNVNAIKKINGVFPFQYQTSCI